MWRKLSLKSSNGKSTKRLSVGTGWRPKLARWAKCVPLRTEHTRNATLTTQCLWTIRVAKMSVHFCPIIRLKSVATSWKREFANSVKTAAMLMVKMSWELWQTRCQWYPQQLCFTVHKTLAYMELSLNTFLRSTVRSPNTRLRLSKTFAPLTAAPSHRSRTESVFKGHYLKTTI